MNNKRIRLLILIGISITFLIYLPFSNPLLAAFSIASLLTWPGYGVAITLWPDSAQTKSFLRISLSYFISLLLTGTLILIYHFFQITNPIVINSSILVIIGVLFIITVNKKFFVPKKELIGIFLIFSILWILFYILVISS